MLTQHFDVEELKSVCSLTDDLLTQHLLGVPGLNKEPEYPLLIVPNDSVSDEDSAYVDDDFSVEEPLLNRTRHLSFDNEKWQEQVHLHQRGFYPALYEGEALVRFFRDEKLPSIAVESPLFNVFDDAKINTSADFD